MAEAPALIHELQTANANYAASFDAEGVSGRAGQRLLLLTCMDSRIVPHAVFGLKEGDMKVVRNAGGQLNPEVTKDIVLASYLLDCECIVIMPHTRCAMASLSVADVQATLGELSGKDFSGFEPRMIQNAEEKLAQDVAALKANALLKPGVSVHGALYDVDTGTVDWK
jgi:carbonic anhydrase